MISNKITSRSGKNRGSVKDIQTKAVSLTVDAYHQPITSSESRNQDTSTNVCKTRLRGGMYDPQQTQTCPFLAQLQKMNHQCPLAALQCPLASHQCPLTSHQCSLSSQFQSIAGFMYGGDSCGATPVILLSPSSPAASPPSPASSPPSFASSPPSPASSPLRGDPGTASPGTSQRFSLLATPLQSRAVGLDPENTGVRIKLRAMTPEIGESAKYRSSEFTPESQRSKSRTKKRPPRVISKSPFEQPRFHSSAVGEEAPAFKSVSEERPKSPAFKSGIEQRPKSPTFRSLDQSSAEPSASAYDSLVIDSAFLDKLNVSADAEIDYDKLNEEEKRVYRDKQNMKQMKKSILENALEAKKLKELLEQGGGDKTELLQQYKLRKQTIVDYMNEINRLKSGSRTGPTPTAADVEMEVQILPGAEGKLELSQFVTSKTEMPSFDLGPTDEYYERNFDDLVAQGLVKDTPEERKKFEKDKKKYEKMRRSYVGAKDLEHEAKARASKPDWQQDAEEKETMQNLLDGYFQRRRNLLQHYMEQSQLGNKSFKE